MEMQKTTNHLLNSIKSIFFDHLDFTKGEIKYEKFVKELLMKIKEILDVEEVTFLKFNDWQEKIYLESSTKQGLQHVEVGYELLWENLETSDKSYYYNDLPVPVLKDYQLILPLKGPEEMLGLIVIKERIGGPLAISKGEIGDKIIKGFIRLLETALNISKVVTEEQKYKQLFRVTEKFHSSMSMDALLGEIIQTLKEVYPSFTYYLLLSHDNNNHENLPIKDLEYDSENVAAMQAYVTGSVQLEDSLAERKSVLYAPLKGKQGVYGVLQVIAPNTIVFPKNEIEFITLLANTAGSALENAQLYQQSKSLISDLQLINETSHRLNSNLRLSETMNYLKEQIIRSFRAEEIGFLFLYPTGVKALKGSTDFFENPESEAYVTYLKDKISKDRESVFMGDLNLQWPDNHFEYRSLMAVPMMHSGTLKGFAVVLHSEPYFFSFEMFKLLQSLIHHSSLALANSILREELEKMVITDHLTRLFSRSYLDEKISLSMGEQEEGTFILIDIDNFKKVNDTYGHQVGDDILIQVANLINSNIRDSDIGARWGGEEMAIYLPKVPLEIGITVAERLLKKVREQCEPKITISCGVSFWKKEQDDTAEALFKRADEALYVAKATGKDKVIIQKEKAAE